MSNREDAPTETGAETEVVRAWDLRVNDVLAPVGFTLRSVTVDPPIAPGRKVHIVADVLGARDINLNDFVTIQKRTTP